MDPVDRPYETAVVMAVPIFFGFVAAAMFWQGNSFSTWLAVGIGGFWVRLSEFVHGEKMPVLGREKI